MLSRYYGLLRNFGARFLLSFLTNRRRKTARIFGTTVRYASEAWFLHSLEDIFVAQAYLFASDTRAPLIVDCGANIGLSIIFFKRLFPGARVVGIEADPKNFALLAHNVSAFGLKDVELVNKAVWSEPGTVTFLAKASVGSRIVGRGETSARHVEVPAVPLVDVIRNRDVDFLKIDIEGAEWPVLQACRHELGRVRNLFVEYHGVPGQPQMLPELLSILRDAGFRYYIREAWENYARPFIRRETPVYDLQVNIFAYRLEAATSGGGSAAAMSPRHE